MSVNRRSDDERRTDERFMAEALAVAAGNLGFTGANPSVGCLIVTRDGPGCQVVAAAVTAPGGRPHAETQALAQAGERARGATAYVTLEPCSHHGQTPPCADALISAGVSRVVISVIDPDPRVSGRGVAMLRAAGIAVTTGILAAEGERALEYYLMRKRSGRPYVTVKLAVSADGMIGRTGHAQGAGQVRITGNESRAYVQRLRAQSDAILVGIGTALADDPELTVRIPGLEARSPIRIVLDGDLRLPPDSNLVRTARTVPVIAVAAETAADEDAGRAMRRAALEALGVEVLDGDPRRLDLLLPALGSRGLSGLLVEGGAKTAASFLEAGLVDRILLFTGPGLVGADGVRSPLVSGDVPNGFSHISLQGFGPDRLDIYERTS